MLSQPKVKAKPPPLRLPQCNVEAENNDRFASSPMGHAMADYEENEAQAEFYHQFESTLTQLLHKDDLMPFNLHTAASLGITSSVRHLIERCQVDPNSRNSGNWTAIMYASLFSHNETVLYLLEMKADVNLKNPNGKTPLMLAALCGSEETIKLLLMHGALIEERDHDQFTALMLAIQATHGESAQLLLDYGANPNVREEIHGQTPLYIAAQSGQFAIARALIQKGVNVNAKTSSGDTAYHVALRNGYAPIANMISEQQQEQQMRHQQQCNTHSTEAFGNTKKAKPTHLFLAPAPTRFKPKSPYTAFFERFAEFPEFSAPASNQIPDVVIDNVEGVVPEAQWFPSPGDITRCSPEGVESAKEAFNPFNAWPGTSMIFKQAIASTGNDHQRPRHFKKSIAKPIPVSVSKMLLSPWSPAGEQRYPIVGSNDASSSRYEENASVKLPKDLSTVLANLGLAKYQMHFEEQDIDLQVFLTMNENDLREIGVNSLGARRKFLSTIEYFQTRSNHYRISEEFLVNTWVCKQDLAELKVVWNDMTKTVEELRNLHDIDKSPRAVRKRNAHLDHLLKQMQYAEGFFKKY
ncbi:hypothetical protein OUZ56_013496 [Daphnia magna]|uniref:NAD(+) ADP-ribosyltransferase n=1 Tax=Daphnia magna TaxID=35525 RepID=A0ABQ9Z619_9CRUS|nr:hypothetical protein OUZ56_013496 [Daphnia magna]